MKNTVIGLIVLSVLAGGVYWAYQRTNNVAFAGVVEEDNAVLVVDQPSSDEVVVSYAKLSKPGYVVVHGVNSSGQTEVVGTSDLLPAGEYKNVRVLTRSKLGTNERLARLRVSVVADNGDNTYSASDTEVLVAADENTEAEVDPNAENPEDLSAEYIVGLLDEAGYTVESDAETTIDDLTSVEDTSGGSMEEGTTSDEMMGEEGTSTMEEGGSASGTVEEGTEVSPDQEGQEPVL